MKLTPEQLAELNRIISDAFSALAVNVAGTQAVTEETLNRLRVLGLVKPDVEIRSLEDAYLSGMAAIQLGEKGQTLTLAQAKKHLAANPVPFSAAERQAIQVASMSAGEHIKGFGDKVRNSIGQKVLTTNRKALARAAQMRGKVRAITARAIENRKSISEVVSDFGHEVGEGWTRDWHRVAATELQSAMNQGRIAEAINKDGADVKLYFIVHPNACDNCVRLLLEPRSRRPRIFKADQIAPAGANVGRKAKDWVACAGTQHPHCFCSCVRLAPGLTLNDQGHVVPEDS